MREKLQTDPTRGRGFGPGRRLSCNTSSRRRLRPTHASILILYICVSHTIAAEQMQRESECGKLARFSASTTDIGIADGEGFSTLVIVLGAAVVVVLVWAPHC
jgi:hypothetical protein